MSIQSEIERLAGAKNDIATSIENQGVTVPSDALLSDMSSLIDQITGDVTSVNGQTGDVVLGAADVGALASDVTYVESVNGASGAVTITVPSGASEVPQDLGVAAIGSSSDWARADHVHAMPSAEDVGAYVKPIGGIPASDLAEGVIPSVPSATATTPLMDGAASVGTETSWARGDHIHPIDTSRAGADIIAVQSAQPSSSTNKLWIDSTASANAVQLATVDDIPQAVVLYYPNVTVASGSGVIAMISSASITDVHIVAQCSFTNPNYITSDIQWATTTGQVTLSGTCSSATTASLILLKPY